MHQKFFIPLILLLLCGQNSIAQWEPSKINKVRQQTGNINKSAWQVKTILKTHYFIEETKLSKKKFLNTIANADEDLAKLVQQYRTNNITGNIIYPIGALTAASAAFAMMVSQKGDKAIAAVLIGGAGVAATGLVLINIANRKYKKAVKLFNVKAKQGSLQSDKSATISFGIQPAGIGLSLQF